MTVRRNKSIMVFILVVALFCGMVMFSPRVSAAGNATIKVASEVDLQNAFANVENNGTIQITSDITLTSDISTTTDNSFTLDLNGYTISSNTFLFINLNLGTITIEDTSSKQTGTIISLGSDNNVAVFNEGAGSIVVSSGNILSNNGSALFNDNSGSIIVSGGNIIGKGLGCFGIANTDDGSIIVSGGTIEATRGYAICNAVSGSVMLSGGDLKAFLSGITNFGTGSIAVIGGTIDAYSADDGMGIMMSSDNVGKLDINYGSSTIKGKQKAIDLNASALSIASALDCVAYNEYAMTTKQEYNAADLANYKALVFSATEIPVSYSGLEFTAKAAKEDGIITIGKDIPDFSAAGNYGGLDASGLQPNIGSVETAGTDGSVTTGSIVITLNKAYLNTLKAGTYKLVVNLNGSYNGAQVSVDIAVKKASTTPNTGDDQMIVVWASMLIITACVGAVVIKKKKSSVN